MPPGFRLAWYRLPPVGVGVSVKPLNVCRGCHLKGGVGGGTFHSLVYQLPRSNQRDHDSIQGLTTSPAAVDDAACPRWRSGRNMNCSAMLGLRAVSPVQLGRDRASAQDLPCELKPVPTQARCDCGHWLQGSRVSRLSGSVVGRLACSAMNLVRRSRLDRLLRAFGRDEAVVRGSQRSSRLEGLTSASPSHIVN